jgi:hypothetical protein
MGPAHLPDPGRRPGRGMNQRIAASGGRVVGAGSRVLLAVPGGAPQLGDGLYQVSP